MNEEDVVVERVLQALGDVEPAAGMEARLLERLHGAAAERIAKPKVRWWQRTPVWATAAVLLCAAAVGLWKLEHLPQTTQVEYVAEAAAPKPARKQEIARAGAEAKSRDAVLPRRDGAVRKDAAVNEATAQTEESFPAPPLPLTDQERLLLRLKRRSDPVELAQLSPPEQRAAAERDKQEVKEFFRPPPPLPDPYNDRPAPKTYSDLIHSSNPGEAQ